MSSETTKYANERGQSQQRVAWAKLARSEAPDKQVEELMQQVIAGREWLFQRGYPHQLPVQKAIRKLAAKLDVTSADNGQNTRQNSTIPFSL
jgi:hypothetical protein